MISNTPCNPADAADPAAFGHPATVPAMFGWLVEWLINRLAVGCQHLPRWAQLHQLGGQILPRCGPKSFRMGALGGLGCILAPIWGVHGAILLPSWRILSTPWVKVADLLLPKPSCIDVGMDFRPLGISPDTQKLYKNLRFSIVFVTLAASSWKSSWCCLEACWHPR